MNLPDLFPKLSEAICSKPKFWQRLTGEDRDLALRAAKHWALYEIACCTLLPNAEFMDHFAAPDVAWAVARLEAHYFRNVKPEPDTLLLDRVNGIRHIPAIAVHGRYDIVCSVKNLIDLAQVWPELDTVISPDSGHSSHEPGITKELVAATNRIVKNGNPCLL